MKTVFVLSGGTATAWNLCNAIRKVGKKDVFLVVCDTNPKHLVHSSSLADIFLQVLPIGSEGYQEQMYSLFAQHSANIVIPLIDWDLEIFYRDNPELLKQHIFSSAPEKETLNKLTDKEKLYATAKALNIPSPKLYQINEVEENEYYFVKPKIGFGSRGAKKMLGKEIKKEKREDIIIQSLCIPSEITVDISSNAGEVNCICRERIETKAGVCTKARIYYSGEIEEHIRKIAKALPLPEVCCAQFMKSQDGEWLLTDFNLRLGAGSALSAAVGFTAAECAVAQWLKKDKLYSLQIPKEEHYVVRHYQEIVTK